MKFQIIRNDIWRFELYAHLKKNGYIFWIKILLFSLLQIWKHFAALLTFFASNSTTEIFQQ